MIVTGVPKLDPIIKAKQQGSPLPPGWEKLSGKTVFLWNSWFDITVSSLRFFGDIFKWFQGHEDTALIWRPHPMTETVVKLYSPERYSDLRQYFFLVGHASNMILDRETSYLPAFSCSNAQISDHSSLMQQYLPMDKPLLWVDTLAPSMTKEEFISTKWMERASTAEEVLQFLDHVTAGKDVNAQLRKQVYDQELSTADGHCGARVCSRLWDCLHREDRLGILDGED